MPLITDRLRLRELRPRDYQMLVTLRNDLATQGWSRALPPDFTVEMYRKRLEGREYSFDRRDAIFAVDLVETEETIGQASYSGLVDRRTALIGVALLPAFHGHGYAQEINEALLELLFHQMGLQTVGLYTHSGNVGAVRSAEKSGFSVSVRIREAVFLAGKHHDNLFMDMTREEFYERRSHLQDGL